MLRRAILAFALALPLAAQTSIAPPPAQQQTQGPEMTQNDVVSPVFHSRVNLVMIPVVVRDSKGKTIAGLKKDDFILSEHGKPQDVSRFSQEKSSAQAIRFAEEPDATPAGDAAAKAQASAPQRFVAYLFDDVHAKFADLARARDAALKTAIPTLNPSDRAGIFTTSGQLQLDFTDDRDQLNQTLARLSPHPIAGQYMQQCVDIPLYMADMIVNKNDAQALQAVVNEIIACENQQQTPLPMLQQQAMGRAQQIVGTGEHDTRVSLDVLRQLIRRMSTSPGQRIVVLASPGFYSSANIQEKMEIMDRAIKANVIINSLDIRGLWTDPSIDASRTGGSDSFASRIISGYLRDSMHADSDVLAEMAAGTGGSIFENNNDLNEGFARMAVAPDTYYLLGFSPQNLKLDGSFHGIKVTLKAPNKYEIQARKGYYSPKHIDNEAENTKAEIEEALFSREDLRELPIALHTQFFKNSDDKATVTVLAHLDVKKFRYKKEEGRNKNQVTVVSALFDRNGNLVDATEKILTMQLRDETLAGKVDNGLTVRTQFTVKPGTYLVRLVVRDSEGQMLSAQNSAVNIQ
jgi:VWFA-related protein